MGLAGPKYKQRISADPNNLNWSRDQTKFGFKMLEKMGWTPGKGLGVNEDGSEEHIKVRFKQDVLGVGADKRNSDNWLENTDAFTRLLNELNERVNCEVSDSENNNVIKRKEKKKDMQKMKRSNDEMEVDNIEDKKDKKKKKKEEKEYITGKRMKKPTNESNVVITTEHSRASSPTSLNPPKIPQTMVRFASRSKFRRNKSVSSYSTEDLNKILGVKSCPMTPTFNDLSNISSIKEDKVQENIVGVQFEHKKISAANYFAERLKNMNATGIAVTGRTLTSQKTRSPSPESLRPSFSLGFSIPSTESHTLLPKSASPYMQKMNFQLSTTTNISTLDVSSRTVNNNNNDVCAKELEIRPQKNKKRKTIVAIDNGKKGKKTKRKEMEEQKIKKKKKTV